ncbi:MAG: hypothetical protein ACO1RA_21150 [Planctomycetaceae bacterium]
MTENPSPNPYAASAVSSAMPSQRILLVGCHYLHLALIHPDSPAFNANWRDL